MKCTILIILLGKLDGVYTNETLSCPPEGTLYCFFFSIKILLWLMDPAARSLQDTSPLLGPTELQQLQNMVAQQGKLSWPTKSNWLPSKPPMPNCSRPLQATRRSKPVWMALPEQFNSTVDTCKGFLRKWKDNYSQYSHITYQESLGLGHGCLGRGYSLR